MPETNQDLAKKNPTEASAKTRISESSNQVAWGIYALLIIGGIGEVLYALAGYDFSKPIKTLDTLFGGLGSTLLISGACLGVGALTGFLFAIPRELDLKAEPTTDNGNAKKSRISNNDNLVQVSDWLTKIIVGVGLTQIYTILPKLKQIGEFLSVSFGQGEVGRNSAIATILYFSVTGFLGGYLWTRLFYVKLIARTNTAVEEIETELDETKAELKEKETELDTARKNLDTKEKVVEAQQNQLHTLSDELMLKEQNLQEREKEITKRNEILDSLARQLSQPEIENNNLLTREPDIEKQIQERNQNNGPLEQLHSLVKERLSNRNIPTESPDDIQKGLWGGIAEREGFTLKATVTESLSHKGWFDVVLEVVKTAGQPMDIPVAFFVHDTFGFEDNVVYAEPDAAGKVSLSLVSYEAFTVGALLPNGIELELDLNEQSGYPGLFYWT